MKTLYKTLMIGILALGLLACEKNDPLADQGSLTGNVIPFNLLAQMPDARVGDTLELRTVCWAIDDNIETVAFYHQGYKLKDYSLKLAVQTADSLYVLAAALKLDTIFIPEQLIASFPDEENSLDDFYETLENAYVVTTDFIVPTDYTLSNFTGAAVIDEMNDETFALMVAMLSEQMNRPIVQIMFPGAPITVYEYDNQGNPTGGLSQFGYQYIRENLSRELLKNYLNEAEVTDNTRARVRSLASLAQNQGSRESVRQFRVIR